MNRTLYILLAIFAALCLFTGCASKPDAGVASVRTGLSNIRESAQRARGDGKAVLSHLREVRSNLQRAESDAKEILRMLGWPFSK